MKKLKCKKIDDGSRLLFFLAAVGIGIALTAWNGFADNTAPNPPGSDKDKIHITAETLMVDSQARFAEFKGNVKASQEGTVIQSDSLKIYYKQKLENNADPKPSEASIEKIVATGHVRITFDNKQAVTEQAVYFTETRTLILTGNHSKISSGADSITGEKITFYRTDGRVKVESGQDQRVEAVFFSGGKGIQ